MVSWPSGAHPFGHYWFMVEGASVGTHGVSFRFPPVRPVLQGDDAPSGKCPHCGKFPTESGEDPGAREDPLDLSEVAAQLQVHDFLLKKNIMLTGCVVKT